MWFFFPLSRARAPGASLSCLSTPIHPLLRRALHATQDLLGSLILSECVYKVLDMEDYRAVQVRSL